MSLATILAVANDNAVTLNGWDLLIIIAICIIVCALFRWGPLR